MMYPYCYKVHIKLRNKSYEDIFSKKFDFRHFKDLTVVLNGGTICNFGRGLIMVVTLWELSLATQPSGVHCI